MENTHQVSTHNDLRASLLHGCCLREGISLGQSLLKMTNWEKGYLPALLVCWYDRSTSGARTQALAVQGRFLRFTHAQRCQALTAAFHLLIFLIIFLSVSESLTSTAIYFERLSACCMAQFCSGFQPHHIT